MGSIAMMVDAPAMRAPCTALKPSGPHPTTATVDPGSSVASVPEVVAPRPATLTQLHTMPRSATLALDTTGTTHSSSVTMSSARPPMCEFEYTGVPSRRSATGTRSDARLRPSHGQMSARPRKQ